VSKGNRHNPKRNVGFRFVGFVVNLLCPDRFAGQSMKTTYGDVIGLEIRKGKEIVATRDFKVNGDVPAEEIRKFAAAEITEDLTGDPENREVSGLVEKLLDPDFSNIHDVLEEKLQSVLANAS